MSEYVGADFARARDGLDKARPMWQFNEIVAYRISAETYDALCDLLGTHVTASVNGASK